jgi:hypothetical protein
MLKAQAIIVLVLFQIFLFHFRARIPVIEFERQRDATYVKEVNRIRVNFS